MNEEKIKSQLTFDFVAEQFKIKNKYFYSANKGKKYGDLIDSNSSGKNGLTP